MHKNQHGALLPESSTAALKAYTNEMADSELRIVFMLLGNYYIDVNRDNALNDLVQLYETDNQNPPTAKWVGLLRSDEGGKFLNVRSYQHHYGQMALARMIDNLTTYLKDLLEEVIVKHPEILKSKEQERLDFILGFKDLQALHKALIDKKIKELFYKGIDDIERYFDDRLGIQIFKSPEEKRTIDRLIKQRNLIVHNRGRITAEFIKEFEDIDAPPGYLFTFTYEELSSLNVALYNYLVILDLEVAEKFNLELLSNW